jgi:hypothetical protein
MDRDCFELYLQYENELAEAKQKIIKRFLGVVRLPHDKRASKVKCIEDVLKAAGRPVHVSEIIEMARRDFHVELNRDSIVSMVVKKVKAGHTFIRTAPNTFAIKPKDADTGLSEKKGSQG